MLETFILYRMAGCVRSFTGHSGPVHSLHVEQGNYVCFSRVFADN